MCRLQRGLLLTGSVLLSILLASGYAQVTTTVTHDGTLGTTVTRNGTIYDITGGRRPGNNGRGTTAPICFIVLTILVWRREIRRASAARRGLRTS
jgi:hypothetical protein